MDSPKLFQKIIQQTIKDLAAVRGRHFDDASAYVIGPLFSDHRKYAQYPEELNDVLREMVLLSWAERIHLGNSVQELLDDVWTPTK